MGLQIKNKKLEDYGYADTEIKRYADLKQRQILRKMVRAEKRFTRTMLAKKIPEETIHQVWQHLMDVVKKYSAEDPQLCPLKYTNQVDLDEMRDAGIDDAVARLIEQSKVRIHFSYDYALHAMHPEANYA